MTLHYQATLDELAEPAIRFFLRSKTARKNRIRSTLVGALAVAAALFFVFRDQAPSLHLAAAFSGGILTGALLFWSYAPR